MTAASSSSWRGAPLAPDAVHRINALFDIDVFTGKRGYTTIAIGRVRP
jgi:hypothetical protein